MKHVYILAAGLLVLAAGGYYWLHMSAGELTRPTTLAPVLFEATLTPLSTDVSVATSSSLGLVVVDEPATVTDGSKIETSPTGRAIITTDDGEIVTSLDANTSLVLAAPDTEKGTRIELKSGRLWAQVGRSLEVDESYKVYTPTLVAAVRGTSFGVEAGVRPRIIVTEGEVWVGKRSMETGEFIPETDVVVLPGQTVEQIDGEFVTRDTGENDRDTWYYEFNNQEQGSEMIEIDPPTLVIPVTPPAEPEPQPVACTQDAMMCPDGSFVGRVGPNCEFAACPLVEEPVIEPLTFEYIDPDLFDDPEENRLRVYGSGFTDLDEVYLDNWNTEFTLVNDNYFIIEKDELRGNGRYDLTLVRGDEELLIEDALEVDLPETDPDPILFISDVRTEFDPSQEISTTYIVGGGMQLVSAVFMNGQAVLEYEVVSDTEIIVYDYFEVSEVRITGNGEEAIWP